MGFNNEQKILISEALQSYKGEMVKLMKKVEKLGRMKEFATFKMAVLEIEAIRSHLDD